MVTLGLGDRVLGNWVCGEVGKWGSEEVRKWGSGEVGKWGISTKTLKP